MAGNLDVQIRAVVILESARHLIAGHRFDDGLTILDAVVSATRGPIAPCLTAWRAAVEMCRNRPDDDTAWALEGRTWCEIWGIPSVVDLPSPPAPEENR